MRILQVVTSLEPGGMENGVVNLARLLQPAACSFHVCCLERGGAFVDRLPQGVGVSVLGKGAGFSPRAAFQLARLIRVTRPHLIHSHNLGPLIYSGLATGWGTWRPVLHGEHAEMNDEELSPRRLRQRRALYGACRRVHAVSTNLRDHLMALGFPGKKIEVIVNGVDTERFRPGDREAARRRVNLPADATVVGIVGRFGPFKRHSVLIEAFTRLALRQPRLHLLVVGGGGSEQDQVAEQARRSEAANRIHLTGFQNDAAGYYQTMDLLVMPSVNEGMSNALLEGMASGVPALCHDACGNREVVSHGEDGFVFALPTADELVTRLEASLADPPRLIEMGRRARAKVVARYSLPHMGRAYERVYRELAPET